MCGKLCDKQRVELLTVSKYKNSMKKIQPKDDKLIYINNS